MAVKPQIKIGRVRLRYCPGWRNKPQPWWFRGKYSKGGCVQSMGLEVWW